MATLAGFRARFPEFDNASDTYVQTALDDAALSTYADMYGSSALADQAVMLKAAIHLVESPRAREMRVNIPGEQVYTYMSRLQRLQRSAAMGVRVF